MKPTAILINTGRAGLVDEDALFDALKNKRIGGAALDVHAYEPLQKKSRWLGLDNVTLTPHIAGTTAEALTNSPYLLVRDINKLLSGEKPQFILNPEVLEHPKVKAWLSGVRLREEIAMIVDLPSVLVKARRGGYCVGAFNVYNLETVDAVLAAAEELRSPVIIAFGERYLKNFPIRAVAAIVKTLAQDSPVPVVLHLDHAQKLESIEQAIAAGFTSVMIDGSKFPLSENISVTKQAVALARPRNVSVEAELGRITRDRHRGG